ncbi:hypothetical protein ESCO_003857 [Escovopsis weberi]|uniref:Uncharacterized protein n=1 Tax=Escovopsis weberi TaxID=150374 RepID=A0A0M8N9F5_ESCWE|nr:hypothetical protein ESCO_003857 [Escovopsis weberi]
MLQKGLKEKLNSSQEALQQDKGQLHELELQYNDSQEALAALQQRSSEAQQKFDDLTKWLWSSPETRLLQQSFRIVVDSLAHEMVSAEAESESAARALGASQAIVAGKEADVRQLASASKAQFELLTQGVSLLDTSTTLLEEVQKMQAEVSDMRGKRNAAWDHVSRFIHRSQQADLTLQKVDYARLILQIVETLLEDDSLHLTLAGIVKHLAQNDDGRSSMRAHVDKHPEGLLNYVSAGLGLPEDQITPKRPFASQEAAEQPLSERHVQEQEGSIPEQSVKPEERVQPEEGVKPEDQGEVAKAGEDESDSEWDKISVPFKPYGDFDRSSIRITLNYKDPFPLDKAGKPPCSEPDGSPVYLASAVDLDGSKQPCKYSPALQTNGVRVPYRGEEFRHHGGYELLPYIPELMEFVGAKNGQLPAGRRGVVGGNEEGGQLYHAIAKVEGVWVPGKTARRGGGIWRH